MNAMAGSRLYYMDNLRALAMLMGVLFHAALAYSPRIENIWVTADMQQSLLLDVVVWFSHLFRMPLFFLIAGFFVAYLAVKRGMGGMLKNRSLRLLLPFIIFLPLCTAAIIAPMLSAAVDVQHKSPILQMIVDAMNNPDSPKPPPSTLHLWFLYNLVFFCVFTWILSYLNWTWLRHYLATMKPWAFIVLMPLLLLPAVLSALSPKPAPDSFLPQLWSFGFFGLFFALGYLMYGIENFIDRFKPYALSLLLLSCALYAMYYLFLPAHISIVPEVIPFPKKLLLGVCEAYIALWMTLVCLVYAQRYLNSHRRAMRLWADSSYWIYIVHFPLILFVQYPLMDKEWGVATEFSLTLVATFTIGMISYLLLVRWTPIGWMLNGRR